MAYAIGKAHPVGLFVETFGTGRDPGRRHPARGHRGLRPAAGRDHPRPRPAAARSTRQTAAYGHFGRELPDFTWERTDRVDAAARGRGRLSPARRRDRAIPRPAPGPAAGRRVLVGPAPCQLCAPAATSGDRPERGRRRAAGRPGRGRRPARAPGPAVRLPRPRAARRGGPPGSAGAGAVRRAAGRRVRRRPGRAVGRGRRRAAARPPGQGGVHRTGARPAGRSPWPGRWPTGTPARWPTSCAWRCHPGTRAVEAEPAGEPAAPADGTDRRGRRAGPGAGTPPGRRSCARSRSGRAPAAVWTALPGPTWPDELAVAVQAALAAGRGALVVVPDHRDVARVGAAIATRLRRRAARRPDRRARSRASATGAGWRSGAAPSAPSSAPGRRCSPRSRDLGLVVVWDDGDDLHAEPRAPYPHVREVLALRAAHAGRARCSSAVWRVRPRRPTSSRPGRAHAGRGTARAGPRGPPPRCGPPGTTPSSPATAPPGRRGCPTLAWQTARDALRTGPVLVQVPRRGYLPALACVALPHAGAVHRLRRSAGACGSGRHRRALPVVRSALATGWRCPVVRGGPVPRRRGRAPAHRGGARPRVPRRARAHVGPRRGPGPRRRRPGAGRRDAGGRAGRGRRVRRGAAARRLGAARAARTCAPARRRCGAGWRRPPWCVRRPTAGGWSSLADSGLRPVQALLRWDPAGAAERELADRRRLRFPPAVTVAALRGAADAVADLLAASHGQLPAGADVLGPTPYGDGGRARAGAGRPRAAADAWPQRSRPVRPSAVPARRATSSPSPSTRPTSAEGRDPGAAIGEDGRVPRPWTPSSSTWAACWPTGTRATSTAGSSTATRPRWRSSSPPSHDQRVEPRHGRRPGPGRGCRRAGRRAPAPRAADPGVGGPLGGHARRRDRRDGRRRRRARRRRRTPPRPHELVGRDLPCARGTGTRRSPGSRGSSCRASTAWPSRTRSCTGVLVRAVRRRPAHVRVRRRQRQPTSRPPWGSASPASSSRPRRPCATTSSGWACSSTGRRPADPRMSAWPSSRSACSATRSCARRPTRSSTSTRSCARWSRT